MLPRLIPFHQGTVHTYLSHAGIDDRKTDVGLGDLVTVRNEKDNVLKATFVFVAVTFVFIILANTWAKKK